jgi:PTS system nitrogen regulatory IIA component
MKPRPTLARPVMKVKEIAEYLRVNSNTVRRWIRKGEIPAFKVGTDYRFKRDEIDKWIAEKTLPTS